MLLSGLIPLFVHKYFVTLDGPAHLYSSFIIKSLVMDPFPAISRLFTINPFPVPNSISHFCFALFSTFLPGHLTEKVVIFLYLFLTPLIFRKLVLFLRPENRILSWPMILFVHNQNFYFGFFNLSFGILFMFLTVYFYLRYYRIERNSHILLLGGLFLALYFSHLMIFMVTLVLLILLAVHPVSLSKGPSGIKISGFKSAAGNFLRISAAALPAVILTLLFLSTTDPLEQHPERLGFSLLAEWVAAIRPLLALRYGFPWKSYTYLLFLVFLVMTVTASVRIYRSHGEKRRMPSEHPAPFRLTPAILFSLFTLGSLALFFILPNTILLSERLILLFYLFLITALALFRYPRWIHFALAVTVIILHISFTRMYTYTIGDYSEKAEKTAEIVKGVEPGALVLPLNYNEKWIFMHISGYAGVNQPLAILENYEAGLPWFPVRWNRDYYAIGFMNRSDASNTRQLCENYLHPELPGYFSLKKSDGTPEIIPYILVIHPSLKGSPGIPPCAAAILEHSYPVERVTDFCTLYSVRR